MLDFHHILGMRFLRMLADRQQANPNPWMNYDEQPFNPQMLPQQNQAALRQSHRPPTDMTVVGGRPFSFNPHARLDTSQIIDKRSPTDPSRANVQLTEPAEIWHQGTNGPVVGRNNNSPQPQARLRTAMEMLKKNKKNKRR